MRWGGVAIALAMVGCTGAPGGIAENPTSESRGTSVPPTAAPPGIITPKLNAPPTLPVPISPAEGSHNTLESVQFQFVPPTDADGDRIEVTVVVRDEATGAQETIRCTGPSCVHHGLKLAHSYSWVVSASDGKSTVSSPRVFFRTNSPPSIPIPVDPLAGSHHTLSNARFTFLPSTDLDRDSLRYFLALSGRARIECQIGTCQAILAEGASHEYRIIATDGVSEAASPAIVFRTDAAPIVDGLLRELDGLEQVPRSARLTWPDAIDPDGDLVSYSITLSTARFQSEICASRSTTCEMLDLLPATTYTVSLRATDVYGLARTTSATFTTQRPVVFIHGYRGGSGTWDGMLESLVAEGYPVVDFDRSRVGVQAMAYDSIVDGGVALVATREVAPRIEAALIASGLAATTPIDVVAHSMGGLVARWLVEGAGSTVKVRDYSVATPEKWGSQIRTLVTLATPHHGSNWSFCFTDVCEDMSPGSEFLEFLGYEPKPARVRYFTAGGGEDAIVHWESAKLESSDWTFIEDACHTDASCRIVGHQDALDLVLRALATRRP